MKINFTRQFITVIVTTPLCNNSGSDTVQSAGQVLGYVTFQKVAFFTATAVRVTDLTNKCRLYFSFKYATN
jgi:hypothetical protein